MTAENVSTHNEVPKFGKRHIQVILLAAMMAIAIGMRMELSIAIVAMNDNSTSSNPSIPTFNWTNKSLVLSSFYWGYITLQLVAGSLGRKYGTKMLLVGAMGINAVVSVLLPTAAVKAGSYGVIACRIIQGVSQGFFFPSFFSILGCWAPVNERSRLGSFGLAGYAFGSIIGQPITGYLSSSWLGWPSAFYLYGCLGFIWIVFWILFGAGTPADHKTITAAEKEYIEKSLGTEDEKPASVPWKSIFTSVPVYGLTIAHIGFTFGNVALANETPIYLNKVLDFDIQWNSIISSGSSLLGLVISLIVGELADFLINGKYLSRGGTRKLFCSTTCLLSSLGMAVLSFLSSDDKVWSVLMILVVGLGTGAFTGGPGVNHIDLSPRYAGIIMAITNTCGSMFSILGPVIVQVIVTDETNTSQWKLFFYIGIGMYLAANLIFVAFGSGELQPWDSAGVDLSKQEDVDQRRRKVSNLSLTNF